MRKLAGPGNASEEVGRRGALVRSLARAYTSALLTGDPAEAERVVRDAMDAGLAEQVIAAEVITPGMHEVGDLWEANELTVADEHIATHISLRVLALQREAFRVARGRSGQRVMLGAVEGEHHVLGLQMAGNLLAHAGFDVRFLGADVPTESLGPIVTRHEPEAFCLTATIPGSSDLLPLAVDELRRVAPDMIIVIGGAAASDPLPGEPSVAVVPHLTELVETVDALLHRPSLN